MIISILLFDDAELLDWAGPVQVFSAASRFIDDDVDIRYYGYGSERIRSGNLNILCNGLWPHLSDLSPDMAIVPGGGGVEWIFTDKTRSTLQEISEAGSEIVSVCTGSLLLAHAGLLSGRSATTHHENFEELAKLAPDCNIERGVRYTASPPVFTAGGVSAGIDLALSLVARKWGSKSAQQTAAFIEYPLHGTQQNAF